MIILQNKKCKNLSINFKRQSLPMPTYLPHPHDLTQKPVQVHFDTYTTSAILVLCYQLVMLVFSIARRYSKSVATLASTSSMTGAGRVSTLWAWRADKSSTRG